MRMFMAFPATRNRRPVKDDMNMEPGIYSRICNLWDYQRIFVNEYNGDGFFKRECLSEIRGSFISIESSRSEHLAHSMENGNPGSYKAWRLINVWNNCIFGDNKTYVFARIARGLKRYSFESAENNNPVHIIGIAVNKNNPLWSKTYYYCTKNTSNATFELASEYVAGTVESIVDYAVDNGDIVTCKNCRRKLKI
jgi:hypothetical protein